MTLEGCAELMNGKWRLAKPSKAVLITIKQMKATRNERCKGDGCKDEVDEV